MSVLKIPEIKTDVTETLSAVSEISGSLSGVMILALDKDGRQHLYSSSMSQMEKSFLVAFLNAWISKWFRLEDT